MHCLLCPLLGFSTVHVSVSQTLPFTLSLQEATAPTEHVTYRMAARLHQQLNSQHLSPLRQKQQQQQHFPSASAGSRHLHLTILGTCDIVVCQIVEVGISTDAHGKRDSTRSINRSM